jgi:hypothetical protein
MELVKWFFAEKLLMISFYSVIASAKFPDNSAPLSPMASGVVQKGRIELPFTIIPPPP